MSREHPQSSGTPRLSILYSFPGIFGSPGVGWTAWNQVNELVESGHDVHLITTSVAKPVAGLASLRTTLTLAGRRVPHRLLGHLRSYSWHDWQTSHHVGRLSPDVIHVWPGSGLRTMTAAEVAGVPVVRECPNTHTEQAYEVVGREYAALGLTPSPGGSHTRDERRLAIERKEWDRATGLLVPSAPVAESFLARGIPADRLLRHRYGSTIQRTPRRSASDRPFTAVFLGRCEPRKGLHYALRAWRSAMSDIDGRFLIYGTFDPEYRAALSEDLEQPGVELRGFTDDPLSALEDGDVLLLPTVEEGSALVTYEAQAMGCVPLVSTAAGALLENDVHGLLHEPGDVNALASQIHRLATDPAELARLREAGIARADLSWRAASDALVAAYRKVLASPAESQPLTPDSISVAICTRDRPESLRVALQSIRENCEPLMEVIVVDSGSTTPEPEAVALAAGARYVRSDIPGLSIARNLALHTSDRPIIVYTDDDCCATPGWSEVLLRHFARPEVDVVTGYMRHHGHESVETSTSVYTRTAEGLDAGHGAIMAFRRERTIRLGGFDPTLGAGRRLAGAEDLDMFCRHLAAGGHIVHDPSCSVVHINTREGEDYAKLLLGYGLGLGALANKWVRLAPNTGRQIASIVLRRAVRQVVRPGTLDERRGRRALLRGILSGWASAARMRLVGPIFLDARPPKPVVLARADDLA